MPEDHTDQCYCVVSANADLKSRCIRKGHCVFLKSGLHPKAVHPKSIRVGALTDYFANATCDAISQKWGVSHGYVSNMLARAGIPGRSKVQRAANTKAGQLARIRKLIPYAGKDSKDDEA